MTTFAKVFSSIVTSSIWSEPHHVVRLWLAFLAVKDANGIVEGSVPGIARIANITIPECEDALARFLAPDPYSRDLDRHPERQGRRIEKVDGGWRLLNADYYRDLPGGREPSMTPEAIKKRRQREHRHTGTTGDIEGQPGTTNETIGTVSVSASASGSSSEQKQLNVFSIAFGKHADDLDGLLKVVRFPPAVIAVLTERLNEQKIPADVLGEAVREYMANGDVVRSGQFNVAYFDGFVRRIKGRRAQQVERSTIAQAQRADVEIEVEEREVEDRIARFAEAHPDRYAALVRIAELQIPPTTFGRDVMLRAALGTLIRRENDAE